MVENVGGGLGSGGPAVRKYAAGFTDDRTVEEEVEIWNKWKLLLITDLAERMCAGGCLGRCLANVPIIGRVFGCRN